MEFEEYWGMNPRPLIPESMDDFVKYAQQRYLPYSEQLGVNGVHGFSDDESSNDEVRDYIGESMEILLLYKEWLTEEKKKKLRKIIDSGFGCPPISEWSEEDKERLEKALDGFLIEDAERRT